MITFEVTHNGQQICTAGVNGRGVVSAIVTWISRAPDTLANAPVEFREDLSHEKFDLLVGGLTSG